MSNLYRRNGNIFKANSADATRPDFASGYDVTAYPMGAVADGAASGFAPLTITVHEGHGFVAGERALFNLDPDKFHVINSVTATGITIAGALGVADDEVILNLGTDTGTTSPNYDGSSVSIYSDSNGDTAYSNSRVSTDAQGGYGYWVNRSAVWELIRDGDGTPVEIVPDAVHFGRVIRANPLPTLKSHEVTRGILAGAAGVPDRDYLWMKLEDDSWGWVGPITVAP